MSTHPDFEDFLRLLEANRVEYMIVGGYAGGRKRGRSSFRGSARCCVATRLSPRNELRPLFRSNHGMDLDAVAVNPEGFRAAYRMDEDGRGYVAEYAIPWKLLNCADDPPQSGAPRGGLSGIGSTTAAIPRNYGGSLSGNAPPPGAGRSTSIGRDTTGPPHNRAFLWTGYSLGLRPPGQTHGCESAVDQAIPFERSNPMNAPDQVLFDKINQLPPQRLAELEDFVDFLRTREDDHRLAAAAAKASEASFSQVWDNDDDAAYDRM